MILTLHERGIRVPSLSLDKPPKHVKVNGGLTRDGRGDTIVRVSRVLLRKDVTNLVEYLAGKSATWISRREDRETRKRSRGGRLSEIVEDGRGDAL